MSFIDTIKKASTGQTAEPMAAETTNRQEAAAHFYIDSIEADRLEKDRFFRSSPYSPIEDKVEKY